MDKTQIRDKLEQALRKLYYNVDIVKNTICLGRPIHDKSTEQILAMTSAMQKITSPTNSKAYIYVSEQYNDNGEMKKYSIKLTDDKKQSLLSYDFDTRRGLHYHEFSKNRKINKHVSHTLSIEEIANDISKRHEKYIA